MNPHPKTLLSIGECMVEMSQSSTGGYNIGYAGDTFNTAWYARRQLSDDWRVSYLTAVGDDQISDDMLGFIRDAGIDTAHVRRTPGKSVGLYLIHLMNGERSFSYWRENSAARGLADDPGHLRRAIDGADVIYFSGITLAILPPAGRAHLLNALTQARQNGCLIAFDPNIRPNLWSDANLMCAEMTRAAAVADIVLPSFDDEATFFQDATPADTLSRYRAGGQKTVVVKNGGGRILACAADGQTHSFQPETVPAPVDTTAAGDGFNAGFLAAFLAGADMPTAIAKGAGVAAKIIAKPGALVDMSA